MSLPSQQLGGTGMAISRVGIGAWAFGGAGWVDTWGAQEDALSKEAVRAAVERGVNWLDTAPIYGLGHAEDVVGRALRQPADERPYVFTKAGGIWDPQHPYDKPALVGRRTAFGVSSRTRCGASDWTASTSTRYMRRPPMAHRSRGTGRPSATSGRRARSGPSGCPTTMSRNSTRPRPSGTWMPCNRVST
jgi:aryl-alcohol dehydrogenase-like predicted oxidoreductase